MTDPNRLLDRYLDGQLSPDEFSQLERDLASNSKYADAFAAAMMIDALLDDRFERDAIAAAMQLQDGSFLGDEDLRVLQDDYDHAEAETVTIVDLNNKRYPAAKDANSITASQAVSALSYEFKQLVRTKPKPFIMSALAAAAVLLLALVLINPFASETTDPIAGVNESDIPSIDTPAAPTSVVATLTAERDAQWQGASGTALPGVGDGLQPGDRLVLTAGFAEITTNAGAVAILQAPATLELLDSDNALRLHSGKLVGICETQSSKGLLVRTPHMDVTDLGTRFGVEVMPYRSTEVHVHQGEVVVATPKTGKTIKPAQRHITTNQAVRSEGDHRTLASIEPAFDKFDEALRVVRLRGTGYGLAEGDIDPNWQILADANGPLDQPLPVIVQHSYKPEQKLVHHPAEGNDPNVAQWLFFATTSSPYYPHESPADIDASRLTLESRFDIDDTVDLRDKVLYLRFASGEGLHGMRINGTAIKDLPNRGFQDAKTLWHEVEVPIHQAALRNGQNTLQVDLNNQVGPHLANFYLQWELRPKHSNTTPDQDAQPRG